MGFRAPDTSGTQRWVKDVVRGGHCSRAADRTNKLLKEGRNLTLASSGGERCAGLGRNCKKFSSRSLDRRPKLRCVPRTETY